MIDFSITDQFGNFGFAGCLCTVQGQETSAVAARSL